MANDAGRERYNRCWRDSRVNPAYRKMSDEAQCAYKSGKGSIDFCVAAQDYVIDFFSGGSGDMVARYFALKRRAKRRSPKLFAAMMNWFSVMSLADNYQGKL